MMTALNTEGPTTIDLDASVPWLEHLDRPLKGRSLFRSLIASRRAGGPMCRSYAIGDGQERDDALQQLGRDAADSPTIAYGLGALSSRPEQGKRGRGADVAVAGTFAVDLDIKSSGMTKDGALQQIRAVAAKAGLSVSAIVDSGHGLHVYFMLRQPWAMATDDDRLAYSERQRWLADAFGGDHITDIARVMRLPGTWNRKDPANPLLCNVVVWDPAAQADPGQVPRSAAKPASSPALAGKGRACASVQAQPPPPLTDAEAAVLMERLGRLARANNPLRLALSPSLHCESQSHQDFGVLCTLFHLGLTDGEALHVARAVRTLREGGTSAKNARDDYWSATLNNSHKALNIKD